MKKDTIGYNESQSLYTEAEVSANRYNLACLGILATLTIVVYLLNEFGLFSVERNTMLYSMLVAFISFITPVVFYFIHDKLLKRENRVIEKPGFKTFIVYWTYFGIATISVALSFHAILLMVIPTLMATQYRHSKRLFKSVLIVSIILVPIGVYGSFFFGAVDKNMIKGMLTDEEAALFANRLKIATSKRMIELALHYVLPRIISVVSIVYLCYGITRRNSRMLSKQTELAQKVSAEMERMNEIQGRVIEALATLIETRDVGTGEHVVRTGKYVKMIALEMQKDAKYKDVLTDDEIEKMKAAAPLHDVGKIAVSDTILLKPGRLTPEEFDIMKTHTVKGREMIRNIFSGIENTELLRMAEDIAVSHHERWDGTGYPNGLKGEEIPLPARIMAVADVYDALISVRVYKEPIPPEAAIKTMMDESGTHFDPDIMRIVASIKDVLIKAADEPIER